MPPESCAQDFLILIEETEEPPMETRAPIVRIHTCPLMTRRRRFPVSGTYISRCILVPPRSTGRAGEAHRLTHPYSPESAALVTLSLPHGLPPREALGMARGKATIIAGRPTLTTQQRFQGAPPVMAKGRAGDTAPNDPVCALALTNVNECFPGTAGPLIPKTSVPPDSTERG